MKGLLFFGDSIVWGRGEQPNIDWVGRIKELFEQQDFYHVAYNLGICGDTTKELLERMPSEARARIKYLREGDSFRIIIAIGVNDVRYINDKNTPQTTNEEFGQRIEQIVSCAKEFTDDVVLLGLLPVDETKTAPYEGMYYLDEQIHEFNIILEGVAKKSLVKFISLNEVFGEESLEDVLADGLHPNKKGYEIISQFLKKEFVD